MDQTEAWMSLSLRSSPLLLTVKDLKKSLTMRTMLMCVLTCAFVVAALPYDQELQVREPRSAEEGKKEGWEIKADQTRNGGTVVRGEAQKTWDVSKDGKVQGEVHGHWERTYGGPNNGQRDHGAGGSIGGGWGK